MDGNLVGVRHFPDCLIHNVTVCGLLFVYAAGFKENNYEESHKIVSVFVNANRGKRSGLRVQFKY